jgi:hypothetical protein
MKLIKHTMALLALVCAVSAHSAEISIDPISSDVLLGSSFTVDVIGTNFPVTEGGGFSLGFDASILQITSVSIDTAVWDFIANTGTLDNTAGTLTDVLVSSFAGASGNFSVATISFTAIGLGASGLALTESLANPWASGGDLINPAHDQSATVTVNPSPVPVPAAFLLFGSALLGLISVKRVVRA